TRTFVVGGEALTARHVAFWQAFAPDTVLVNEYGPTEATVGCCVYRVPAGSRPAGAVPIGRPVANTRLYVLTAGLRPVPPGEPGELFIGGAGLARGYHDRPDLTAEKFLPDPFGSEPGGRLYRTGDLVRQLPCGDLEFLGRVDRQVKVRGVRIELEEIEAVLAEHPAVRTAAVLAREDGPGERRLVAYVVPRPGRALTAADMRDFLKGRLPEHMVPAALVQVDELPLTPNGKLDVPALPAPGRTHLELPGGFIPARTAAETRMAHLWETVLGIRPVGVRDDFFDLGGDSLLAAGLFAQVHKAFGRDLPAATLLKAPTVERLVNLLADPTEADSQPALVPLQPAGSRPPFFCVHGIGGEILSFGDLARHLGPDQPFYGLQSPRTGDDRRPASLEALAARYLDEVRGVQPHGPYYLGGVSFGGTVAFEMARQLQARGEAVGLLAVVDQRSHPGRSRAPVRLRFVGEFLKNVPRWVWYDLCEAGPAALVTRLRLRARALLPRPGRRRDGDGAAPGAAARKAEAAFDLTRLPDSYRKLLEYHFQILLDYTPRPYPGRVTLLRARAQPLTRVQATDLGWSGLAGGVDVIDVPGSHDTLLREPYVRVLADRLRACLQKAQDVGPPPSTVIPGPLPTRAAEMPGDEEPPTWRVVVNAAGQHALWPADRAAPPGWAAAGRAGSREECLDHIRAAWQGQRPPGPRKTARTAAALAAAPGGAADGRG
ncbi:MAG TPA: thioesterase domain-containing protein, partial [Gemmataceae bacterium]